MKQVNLIIDGNPLLIREYHGRGEMSSPTDRPVGGIYGFLEALRYYSFTYWPDRVFVVWDDRRDFLWRKKVYPLYKQNRSTPMDEDHLLSERALMYQRQELKGLLHCLGCWQLQRSGLEADDLAHWLVYESSMDEQWWVGITIDSDWLQLVGQKCSVEITYGKLEGLYEDYNFSDLLGFVDYREYVLHRAIAGDASDNLRGVEGFGPVKSKKLVEHLRDVGIFPSQCSNYYDTALQSLRHFLSEEEVEVVKRNLYLMDLRFFPLTERIHSMLQTVLQPPSLGGLDEAKRLLWRLGFRNILDGRWLQSFSWFPHYETRSTSLSSG